jgi:MoxR-like ATPase
MNHPIDAHGFLQELGGGATLQIPLPGGCHVIDGQSLNALNAAIAARRPLLVRGEPGTGKSQLARAAAALLGRALVSHTVDARTDTHDLLYTVDHVARLAEAQLLGALRTKRRTAQERLALKNFTRPGPLWWAFDWAGAKKHASEPPHWAPGAWAPEHGCVVLIDEIDKADAMVPNGLLDALGHESFDVHGCNQTVAMNSTKPPLVIITTNEERSLPDAFLRRCMVLQLEFPDAEKLVARGQAHFPACDLEVLRRAATQLTEDRKTCKRLELSKPGTAEYIDLLRVLTTMRPGDTPAQVKLLDTMQQYALSKHPKP